MIYIAHRGNITGPNALRENHPLYHEEAIKRGFDVEVDVWCFDKTGNKCFLGHDKPDYVVTTTWLMNPKMWCHAKNLRALHVMLERGIHCFWHQNDDFTLTSRGYIWTYPDKAPSDKRSIIVNLDDQPAAPGFIGLCSDYVGKFVL